MRTVQNERRVGPLGGVLVLLGFLLLPPGGVSSGSGSGGRGRSVCRHGGAVALLVLTGEGFVGLFGSGAQCLPRLSRELRTYVGERDICELSRSDYDVMMIIMMMTMMILIMDVMRHGNIGTCLVTLD